LSRVIFEKADPVFGKMMKYGSDEANADRSLVSIGVG
jgi:hypothetical protein